MASADAGGARPSGLLASQLMPHDTTAEAAAVHLGVLRSATIAQRLHAAFGYSRSMIALSRASLAARRPTLGAEELALAWVSEQYGSELADAVRQRLAERLGQQPGERAWARATNSTRP